jgi:hypothetical protein
LRGFRASGQIDLTRGVPNITRRGEYQETSAPAVTADLVCVGAEVAGRLPAEIQFYSVSTRAVAANS